jgi:hypothetical protein
MLHRCRGNLLQAGDVAMAKAKEQEVEHVYTWQQADDFGEVRHDFDAITDSGELCDLRAVPAVPQSDSV